MEKSDVLRLTQPLQLLCLVIVLSSLAFSGLSSFMTSGDTPTENVVSRDQVELWKIN